MSHQFRLSSKIRVFNQAARLEFYRSAEGNYDGEITFYGEGIAIDEIIKGAWKKLTGGAKYPFPQFKTRLKTIQTQILDNEQGSLFLIQMVVNDLQISVHFTREANPDSNRDKHSTQIISISSVKPIVIDSLPGVTVEFSEPIVIDFNFHLSTHTTKVHFGDGSFKDFKQGFTYDLNMQLPDTPLETYTFDIPPKEEAFANSNLPATPEHADEAGGFDLKIPSVVWFDLNKKLGPATFYRVGLKLDGEKVWTLLHVDVKFSGLTLALKGLKMGTKLDALGEEVKFGLDGIGIAYNSPMFGVVGLLLADTEAEDYVGSITIKSKLFSIFGAGAYGKIESNHSVFVYSIVDYPLGGPPFFFVEGLALGFGYNRQTNIPPIERLGEFPLISQALGKSPAIDEGDLLNSLATNLAEAFPPSQDSLFLAAGVKFSTFKIFDAFLLLVVGFGDRLKFDLLGIGTLSMPPMVGKPQVFVEVVMKAAIIPDEGAVKIKGTVTENSFILSKDAKLSGGFAFYAWFKDSEVARAGDFVLTLGGYHPKFNKPTHYPEVPRLALTWYVTENFYLKASAYFAVTPSAVMLGGEMKAIYNSKRFKAAFDFDMDLLTQWKPFYYEFSTEISAQLEFEAKVLRIHKKVTMDVGAELELWGPDFSGRAEIDVKVFGMNFDFGLNFGSKEKIEKKISWGAFKEGFLPKENKVLSVSVLDGLVSRSTDGIVTVNPKDLTLRLESVIPANIIDVGEEEKGTGIGIYPMRLEQANSTISVELSDPDAEFEIVDFIYKNVPAALYSKRSTIDLDTPPLVEHTLSGIIIKVGAPEHEEEIELKTENIEYANIEQNDKWDWSDANYQTETVASTFDFDGMMKQYKSEFNLVTPHGEELKNFRSKVMQVEL